MLPIIKKSILYNKVMHILNDILFFLAILCVINIALFLQFFADADDVDAWMMDTYRLVSSEDVGKDEDSVQSLLKKHKVTCIDVLYVKVVGH
jgi:hypothetical protein